MFGIGYRILPMILASLLVGGCPSVWTPAQPSTEPSAEQLYREAEDQYKKKNYSDALETYQRLKRDHPDFDKSPQVYVKIGDALYAEGSYEKAIQRYSQFLDVYPRHQYAPRVKYYIGLSYFNQIKTSDLDNSILQRASESFQALAADPKAGEWAQKAQEKFDECRKKLASKELYKARTYISIGNYKAARLAAQRLLDQYPKLGFDDEANDLLKSIKDK
jgi:outer membrane protein assembly factor BamD